MLLEEILRVRSIEIASINDSKLIRTPLGARSMMVQMQEQGRNLNYINEISLIDAGVEFQVLKSDTLIGHVGPLLTTSRPA